MGLFASCCWFGVCLFGLVWFSCLYCPCFLWVPFSVWFHPCLSFMLEVPSNVYWFLAVHEESCLDSKFKSQDPKGCPAWSMYMELVQLWIWDRAIRGGLWQCQWPYDFSSRLIIFPKKESSTFSVKDHSFALLWLLSPGPEPSWFNASRMQSSPHWSRSPPGVLCTQLWSSCSQFCVLLHFHPNCCKHFSYIIKCSWTISWNLHHILLVRLSVF